LSASPRAARGDRPGPGRPRSPARRAPFISWSRRPRRSTPSPPRWAPWRPNTTRSPLTGRPGEVAPPEHVIVQVKHRLTRPRAVVDHDPEPVLGDALPAGDPADRQLDPSSHLL